MKKAVPKKTNTLEKSPESDIRELLRQFARTILNSQKLRDTAAKKIGSKPSYIRAMLDQRGVGGMSSWSPLMAHCFELQGLDLPTELSRVLESPKKLSGGLTPSEQKFRALDRIPIVNEDVKLQLVTSLEMMLTDLEKSLDSQRKKRS